MTRKRDFPMKQCCFQRRKRVLRVREIVEQIEDKKTITPQLIMEKLNNNTSSSSSSMDDQDPITLEEVKHILLMLRYRFMRNPPSMDNVQPSGDWQPDRLFRFKIVVWKLGGADRAKPGEILEAMRINCDADYYLTLADVEFHLSANATYLKGASSLFRRQRRMFDLMFPAPLIVINDDNSESLSQELEKLSMGANKSSAGMDGIRGSGGPMRRARRVNAAVDSCLYTRMDTVDDSEMT